MALLLFLLGCSAKPSNWVTVSGEPVNADALKQARVVCNWNESVDGYIDGMQTETIWENGSLDKDFEKLYNDLHYCMFSEGFTTPNTLKQLIPMMVERASTSINESTPFPVTEEVRLDSAQHNHRDLRLNHTLIEDAVEDISIERFNELYYEVVISNVCGAEQSQFLLSNGVIFEYFYFDRNGRYITDFHVKKGDCRQ